MWNLFLLVLGILFFWTVILKIVSRLMARIGISSPCPSSVSWLVDNPVRRKYMRPILDRVELKPGERVLELGPGPGMFSVEAARRLLPSGKLVVVDIQPEMVAKVEERIRQEGLENVEFHVASAYQLPLEDVSVDRAFLVTVLPEIPDRQQALMELHRVIKPGGVLSITEEFLDPDYPFISETIHRVEKAGFQLTQKFGNFWMYTVNFIRL